MIPLLLALQTTSGGTSPDGYFFGLPVYGGVTQGGIIVIGGIIVVILVLILLGRFLVLPYLRRFLAELREVKGQVSNNHSTNLREEQDQRHRELLDRFGALDRRVS
ncbi:MAG: hypothetical protein INR62_14185, partial [Rhodospirillales bacterium]|nr:hypothetical protein [Acetobacter sp.]